MAVILIAAMSQRPMGPIPPLSEWALRQTRYDSSRLIVTPPARLFVGANWLGWRCPGDSVRRCRHGLAVRVPLFLAFGNSTLSCARICLAPQTSAREVQCRPPS